jgi:hypothetical protein
MRRFLTIRIVLGGMLAVLPLVASSEALADARLAAQVLRAIADYPANPAPVDELRAAGPKALDELFNLRDDIEEELAAASAAAPTPESLGVVAQFQRRLAKLDEIIDQVGKQRYCSRSRLYWYTDFEQAKAAAAASGKPILSLRMLGNLDEDFSCANSRFFRTTLYANEEISKYLRENYVLHWKSVRPVPKVTIDFGDGRKLERTLTGNSIHYVLMPEGEVVEALPGLYGPQAFLSKLTAASAVVHSAAALGPTDRQQMLLAYHANQFREISERFASDLARVQAGSAPPVLESKPINAAAPPPANVAAAVARPKGIVERPLLAAALPLSSDPTKLEDENVWQAIAALHAEESKLDNASRELIRGENPTAAVAGALAITKRRVEDPLVRLVRTLESSIALDSVKNEYRFHRQIHQWLQNPNVRPEVDWLNERVYAELFLTPSSDPWLGLAPADVYTALPNAGVVTK